MTSQGLHVLCSITTEEVKSSESDEATNTLVEQREVSTAPQDVCPLALRLVDEDSTVHVVERAGLSYRRLEVM